MVPDFSALETLENCPGPRGVLCMNLKEYRVVRIVVDGRTPIGFS